MVAVEFLSQIFGNGKNLRMVLFHSMNAGLVVGTLRDFENTHLTCNEIHFTFFVFRGSGDAKTSCSCLFMLLAPPHIPTSHPWKDQLKVAQIS